MSAVAMKAPRKASLATATARQAAGGKSTKPGQTMPGVVEYCIHGPPSVAGRAARTRGFTPSELIEVIQGGLSVGELDVLRDALQMPREALIAKLGMSKATFHRRQAQGRLDAGESDRLVRFARLTGRAVEVLEGEAPARQWLVSPQVGLGGEVPLDYARTEAGAREVEDLLGRIEYGVYS